MKASPWKIEGAAHEGLAIINFLVPLAPVPLAFVHEDGVRVGMPEHGGPATEQPG